ncbi:MAG: hypothetical protein FWF94_08190 [Oscillospiraceae bacterium]|nr:hypothetical protein [Oscillospiraceae bacterium]
MNDTIQMQNSALMTAGMKLLREKLGLVETEIFIMNVKNTGFDYTEWRENLYEDITLEELVHGAADYMREHPELVPKNATII